MHDLMAYDKNRVVATLLITRLPFQSVALRQLPSRRPVYRTVYGAESFEKFYSDIFPNTRFRPKHSTWYVNFLLVFYGSTHFLTSICDERNFRSFFNEKRSI